MTGIRDASGADAGACAAIYTPYVTDTAISFEAGPPTPAQMAERIATAQRALTRAPRQWKLCLRSGPDNAGRASIA